MTHFTVSATPENPWTVLHVIQTPGDSHIESKFLAHGLIYVNLGTAVGIACNTPTLRHSQAPCNRVDPRRLFSVLFDAMTDKLNIDATNRSILITINR